MNGKVNSGETSDVTQMLAEIDSLRKERDALAQVFVEELGLSRAVADEDEGEVLDTARARAAVRTLRRERDAVAASLLDSQATVDALRKELSYTRASVAKAGDGLTRALVDPGLVRQFRHMESEVEQGREVMNELQVRH